MRTLLLVLLLITATTTSAQIKVDDVGDGWKAQVDSAITLIQTYDPIRYVIVEAHCDRIGYWMGDYSTTEGSTIMISTREMNANNIQNLAAVIVHESLHLYFKDIEAGLEPNREEIACYAYEIEFLRQIPNVDPRLIDHAQKQILTYECFKRGDN